MIRILTLCCLFIGLSFGLLAGPVSPGTFYEFSFTVPGVSVTGCFPADPAGNFLHSQFGYANDLCGCSSMDALSAVGRASISYRRLRFGR
jgi:hypothetical protein